MAGKNTSTTVNPQITDAVTQSNVKVLGEAPAVAMGSLYQTISNSVAMAAANSVNAQQQSNIVYQAATVMCVKSLLNGADLNSIKMPENMFQHSSEILEQQIGLLTAQLKKAQEMEKQATNSDATNRADTPIKKTTTKKRS